MATLNEAILLGVEEHALTPAAIEEVIRLPEQDDVGDRRTELELESRGVQRRIRRILDAIETGSYSTSLMGRLRELEGENARIAADLAGLRPVPRLDPAVVEDVLGRWRRLLRQSITQGRAVIQRVLQGRLTFTPLEDGKGYRFEGTTRFDRLFTGVVVERPSWLKPGDDGTRHIGVEDTLDADYGKLLERATSRRAERNLEKLATLAGWRRVFQIRGAVRVA